MFCMSIAQTEEGNSSARRSFLATASLSPDAAVEKRDRISHSKMLHLATATTIVESDPTRPHKAQLSIR